MSKSGGVVRLFGDQPVTINYHDGGNHMKYVLLAYESDDAFAARTDPARSDEYWGAWMAYGAAISEAGITEGGAATQPPGTATAVKLVNGERQVQDGPYPDSKEHLGGWFLIDVPDLDTALEWAAKCPSSADAGTEVRPLLEM
ncbi:MAG: YciI family protein [Actinomycetota bacterium]